jgi:hypothetical protein
MEKEFKVFLYSVGGSPSNLSAFCFYKQSPVQNSGLNQALVLYLVATQGRGKSIKEINASSKQKVVAPTTFEDLVNRIKFYIGISTILFGEHSPLIFKLKRFKRDIEENLMAVKARLVKDKFYATKILYGMYTRSQRWLGKCKYAEDRAEVDDHIINFSYIIEPMLNYQFNIKLPPVFSMVSNIKNNSKDIFTSNKRKRPDVKEERGMIKMKGTPNPDFPSNQTESGKTSVKSAWTRNYRGTKRRKCVFVGISEVSVSVIVITKSVTLRTPKILQLKMPS